MTAPVFGHVRRGEFSGIDLFALVCLENQTDEEKMEHFGGSSTICDCKTTEGKHPVLCCSTIRSNFFSGSIMYLC